MEHESFNDAEVARLLDDTFIGKLPLMALLMSRAPVPPCTRPVIVYSRGAIEKTSYLESFARWHKSTLSIAGSRRQQL